MQTIQEIRKYGPCKEKKLIKKQNKTTFFKKAGFRLIRQKH